MTKYEIKLEGWVTDTIFVTAADKPEAIKLSTQEFINRKGVENCRVVKITEDYKND